jgi:Arginase family
MPPSHREARNNHGNGTRVQRRHREIAVVWLDAHGDFNTPAITISGYLAGMPVAMLTGRAPELFAEPLGLVPVPERSIVLTDARDLDPAERDALAASQVRHIPATVDAVTAALSEITLSEITLSEITLSGIRDLPVYLHVDVDIVDGAELPGLRFPVGSGPALGDVEDCLAAITARAGGDRPAGRRARRAAHLAGPLRRIEQPETRRRGSSGRDQTFNYKNTRAHAGHQGWGALLVSSRSNGAPQCQTLPDEDCYREQAQQPRRPSPRNSCLITSARRSPPVPLRVAACAISSTW